MPSKFKFLFKWPTRHTNYSKFIQL